MQANENAAGGRRSAFAGVFVIPAALILGQKENCVHCANPAGNSPLSVGLLP